MRGGGQNAVGKLEEALTDFAAQMEAPVAANFILSFKSAKANSGSIIQNSAACLGVFEFSALKVGPKV